MWQLRPPLRHGWPSTVLVEPHRATLRRVIIASPCRRSDPAQHSDDFAVHRDIAAAPDRFGINLLIVDGLEPRACSLGALPHLPHRGY